MASLTSMAALRGTTRRADVRSIAAIIAFALIATLLSVTPAHAAGGVSSALDANSRYPLWYADANGVRVAPCLDGSDAQCILPAAGAEAQFNPAFAANFPTNFPSEFFYWLADSNSIPTPGCRGSKPGLASIRLAVEGAFDSADGLPAPNHQIAFGRIRVRVTSGLCPNTTYQFTHPYGTETITTNNLGAVTAVLGTQDVGCLVAPCGFGQTLASRVFGGFLRWGSGAPSGYLGDVGVPHTVVGATNLEAGLPTNFFRISRTGTRPINISTSLWSVSGKMAGPLASSPSSVDFGGHQIGATAPSSITITNVGTSPVNVTSATIAGSPDFSVANDGCTLALAQDASCTFDLAFSPTGGLGVKSATLEIAHTGGFNSPLRVPLSGTATVATDVAHVLLSPGSLSFSSQRVRVASASQRIVVTNDGTKPLGVTGVSTSDPQFVIDNQDCTGTSVFIAPGATCAVDVSFLPSATGPQAATLDIASNASNASASAALDGTGIGGVAAVSPGRRAESGYPDWYQDENGVRLSPCYDGTDPYCVLPGAGDEPDWNPDLPPDLFASPVNFPTEYFYALADSDVVSTPGCGPVLPGRAFIRMAAEGAFSGLSPVPGEQIMFGRIRVFASGLCPNTEYAFTNPYGVEHFTTNAAGTVTRIAGTEDIGCFPVPPATCDYSLPLQSRLFSGFLRWNPAVAPAAPAGYIGDALTPHRVVGGSYTAPGETAPVDYFRITKVTDNTVAGGTNLWTIAGKMAGPVVATPATVDLGPLPVNNPTPASSSVTITNDGAAAVTVGNQTITGPDAAQFAVAPGGTCTNALLNHADSCVVNLTFMPATTGGKSATLVVSHTGINDPVIVPLHGQGLAAVNFPALSVSPAAITFPNQLVGGTAGSARTVTITNDGGQADLHIAALALGGANGASDFQLSNNTCPIAPAPLAINASCTVDVTFAPTLGGTRTGTLQLDSDAPGSPHTVLLSGFGFVGSASVSATTDANNGFPTWYQDANGARVEACLDITDPTCVLPGAEPHFDPAQPVNFPTNFPTEFFYALADSNPVAISTTCNGEAIAGSADIRLALEGSFANPAADPVAGDQVTFGRIRISADGLCPNTSYRFVHPYGEVTATANALGALVSTDNVGCALGPCNFTDALASPIFGGFLRWNPAFATPPQGHLGDAITPHRVIGGTNGNAFQVFTTTVTPSLAGETNLFTVSGRAPSALTATPTSLTFGNQETATASLAQTVTLTNTGDTPVTVASATTPAGSEFRVDGQTCAVEIPVDGTCTVDVSFRPVSAGAKSDSLSIVHSGSSTPLTVALTGTATLPPVASATVTPGSLAFGNQTVGTPSAVQTVTVTSTGGADLAVSGTSISGPASTDFAALNNCTVPVATPNTCTIDIRFNPSTTGTRAATLTITSNAANGSPAGTHTVALAGQGIAAISSVAPAVIDFATQRVGTPSGARQVVVTNTGIGELNVTGVSLQGANVGDFAFTNGCTSPVSPGPGCTISVTFRPMATGARSASLRILTDTPQSPQTVSLTGTGVASQADLSPTSVSFGGINVVGGTSSKTVTVRNTGTASLNFGGAAAFTIVGANAGDFRITANACLGNSIAIGKTCNITVLFDPSAIGTRLGTLTVASDAINSPNSASLGGTGK